MYYERVLAEHEALFVSRAQQKIADLSVVLADQLSRNDVDQYNAQLILELEYAIDSLMSTTLQWTEDEIQLVIDYYTIEAELTTYPLRNIVFNPTPLANGGDLAGIQDSIKELERRLDEVDTTHQAELDRIELESIERDQILQEQIDNIELNGSSVLSEELTAELEVGGIDEGEVYPEGTPIETIIRDLVGAQQKITDFSFVEYESIVERGSIISITAFSWTELGNISNITLSDNQGQLTNVAVSDGAYIPGTPITYDTTAMSNITWTLSAPDIDDVTLSMDVVLKSYFDKQVTADDSPITVTEEMIENAVTSVLQKTGEQVEIFVNTASTEQGFIAVPKVDSGEDYTKWKVDETNNSDIVIGEFIIPPVDVIVGGIVYRVYRWGYRSPLVDTIILHR